MSKIKYRNKNGEIVDLPFLKGDKGDPFTYSDFTPEQLNSLKGDKGDTGLTPNLSIGSVSTVAPTESASATMTGTKEEPVLNLSIPRGSVTDGDVDPDKTTWMRRVFYNIFDINTVTRGYSFRWNQPTIGEPRVDTNHYVSDFIPVLPNKRYRFRGYHNPSEVNPYLVFKIYDKDKNSFWDCYNQYTIITPDNAAYLRFSINNINGVNENVYVYEDLDGTELPYTEYKTDYVIVSADEEYSEMIRDISSKNTWDLIEEANKFVDYNTGVLSDEQVKAGYLSILQSAGYTNVRSQLEQYKSFYPKDDAVFPKKVVFGLKDKEYLSFDSSYITEKYDGITDIIFDYADPAQGGRWGLLGINKQGSGYSGLNSLSNTVKTIVFPKKMLAIGAWAFGDMPNLEKIVFYNVTEISGRGFYKLPKLKNLHLPVGVGDWSSSLAFSWITLDELTVENGFHSTIYVSSVIGKSNPNAASICHAIIENLADLSGYTLTTQEPSDWSTNYVNYYIKTFEYTLTTEEPSDWSMNYVDYYTKADDVYTQITDEIAPTWVENTYYAKNDVYVQITDETAPTWVEDTYYSSNSKPIYFGTNLLPLIDDEHKQMLTNKNWRYS